MKKKLDLELSLFEKYFGHTKTRSPISKSLELSQNLTWGEYATHAEYSNNVLLPKNIALCLHFPATEHDAGKSLPGPENPDRYIENLMREVAMRAACFSDDRLLSDIFLAGGHSYRLSANQIDNILSEVATLFHLDAPSKTSISVGIDANICGPGDVRRLVNSGISQVVIAVPAPGEQQAGNLKTLGLQKATECIESAMTELDLVSVELWPHAYRSLDDYVSLLKRMAAVGVPNISAYNWWLGECSEINSAKNSQHSNSCLGRKLKIMRIAQDVLVGAGYRHLGLDQFSLSHDDSTHNTMLKIPQHNNNWFPMQGDFDIIGVGLGAVSKFDTAVLANTTTVNQYRSRIEQNALPIERGTVLSDHDRLYMALADQIFHRTEVDLTHSIGRYIGSTDSTTLAEYFAKNLNALSVFAQENLITKTDKGFAITELGRYFLTHIAANFCAPPTGKGGQGGKVVALSQDKYSTDK